jgi:Protein of unknown function (DUF1566)
MYTRIFSMFLIVFLLLTGCGKAATPQPASPVPATTTVPAPTVETAPQATATSTAAPLTYPIVDTGQGKCYDANAEIPCPANGSFFGQDAQYTGLEPGYTSNSDGTVTDANTGLTWQKSPDVDGNGKINAADKLTHAAASDYCENLTLGGSSDWRLPDIKTLYSLIDFRGSDPSGASGQISLVPFLDSSYFAFAYGDSAAGERTTDSQFASSTVYVDTKTNDGVKVFGVNFADGSIRGYSLNAAGGVEKKFFALCVRGNSAYGVNHFADNGDGTISDLATGLVWQKADNGNGLPWQDALAYCEDLSLAGSDDWRLPDAKSLQSLVDTTRSPSTSNSAAIDALFNATGIKNEAGQPDYPFYWTSTTHADLSGKGENGVYIAFGRAMGYMNNTWVDVHGAGAQRSDPKSGNPADFPKGRGPQGDAIRILNYTRCVRGGNVTATPAGNPTSTIPSMMVQVTATQPQPAGTQPSGGGGGSASPEAINACATSSVGDACHFSTIIGEYNGTCQQLISDQITQLIVCVVSFP